MNKTKEFWSGFIFASVLTLLAMAVLWGLGVNINPGTPIGLIAVGLVLRNEADK